MPLPFEVGTPATQLTEKLKISRLVFVQLDTLKTNSEKKTKEKLLSE